MMNTNQTHISDEMLVKYLLGECNAEETNRVELWIGLSRENALHFEQYKRIWDESKNLKIDHIPDESESWQRLKERMLNRKRGLRINYRIVSISVAAGIALIMGIFWFLRNKEPLVENKIVQTEKVQHLPLTIRAQAKTRVDTLPDKSIVTLNRNAVLQCPEQFENGERRVSLQGEAFFNITPDKAKPFFIDAGNDVEIRVVGTSFNVKSFDNFSEVIVETGIVEVRRFSRVILLHPKQKARIDKEDSTIVVQNNEDKLYRYYRNKEFECDNTPLWKVVEVLNEAYGDSIIIGRKDLRGMTLTTTFDHQSLEGILEIISETFDIKVEKVGSKYILK